MSNKYDVIVIGAGSVGTPTAYFLAKKGYKVLVLEKNKAPGRGQNRAAIGGIRATHSDHAKAMLCLKSIEIFKNWYKNTGDDINWYQGGYFYPIYNEKDKDSVLALLKIQKSFGLNIDFISKEEGLKIVPSLCDAGLLGAIYSPEDGSASPLKSNYSFFKQAVKLGAKFLFEQEVIGFIKNNNKYIGLKTDKELFYSDYFVISTGKDVELFSNELKVNIPVKSDLHEAGITEPVTHLFDPMVVDIRAYPSSKNIYFYQNSEGQIVFCLTPSPAKYYESDSSTSEFLPQISSRIFDVYPYFGNLRIRRIWRGYYPNTPDGNPIIEMLHSNILLLAGMCGQGFMLGPGIGEISSKILQKDLTEEEKKIVSELSLFRKFDNIEFFK